VTDRALAGEQSGDVAGQIAPGAAGGPCPRAARPATSGERARRSGASRRGLLVVLDLADATRPCRHGHERQKRGPLHAGGVPPPPPKSGREELLRLRAIQDLGPLGLGGLAQGAPGISGDELVQDAERLGEIAGALGVDGLAEEIVLGTQRRG
jgi:hypothetical protein